MIISVKEVVKTIKIDLDIDLDRKIIFNALIYKSNDGKYSVDILRYDSFKMTPSFGTLGKSDENIYVFDSFFEIVNREFDTSYDLERSLIIEINERLTAPK